MKKSILQKWILSSILIACVLCAMMFLCVPNLTFQPSIGPKIFYYYNDSADMLTEAADCKEFISVLEPSEKVDSVYVLDYEPYDKSFAQFADLKASKKEVDSFMEVFRAEAKAYYSAKNQEFLSSIGADKNSQDYEIVTSDYSPYVHISYEDKFAFQRYEDEFIDNVKTNSDISEIHVTTPIESIEQAASITSSVTRYDMQDVLKDIGADDQTYTGSGLKVGIMEAGGITTENKHPELSGLDIRTAGDSSTEDEHAERVTRLLCGANGVARGIHSAYVYHTALNSSFIPAMNWFLDNLCLVINASLGFPSNAGKYSWASAFMDFQVRYNRVIFCICAGNEGANTNHYVTPPGTAYNAITVANSTKDAYIRNKSSYEVEKELKMNKPTIAAPGTGVITDKNNNLRAGTSYAAPIVTGIVIKLLGEAPALQLFPEAMSAILIASATNANGQSDKWDNRAGAGIVNYRRAREILKNSTCRAFCNNNDAQNSVVMTSEGFTAKKGEKIRAVAIWSANSKTSAWGDAVQSNIHTDYNMILNFVGSSDVSMIQRGGSTNMEFFVLKISLLVESTFRLDVKQANKKIINDDDYGALAWYIE
ncbi:MAG: S8 family serine peptidase [Clostridia bacterium]|nr:S8 family serine peptidase [Clostridia bacterium]